MQEDLHLHVKHGVIQKYSNVSPKLLNAEKCYAHSWIPSAFINTWTH